ncbi:MAG: hypothetical protein ACLR8R_06970 [Oscillospiraceae bacterium]
MKRRLLPSLLLALALALTACATKPAAPTAADFEVQPGAYRYQDIDVFFIETEKGNYCMNPLRDYLIRFAEPGSHDFHILCNKPECKHEDTNCNAYMDIALGYYNGHLYGVQDNNQEFTLIQMDMDATNHRVITQLPKQYDLSGGSSGGGSYFFDNGYLIFLAFPCTSNPDYVLPVYKIQLETGETTQLFQEDIPLLTDWPADSVSISNGYLYFPLPQTSEGKRPYAEGNLETGRIERVFEDWKRENSFIVNFDNVLYYHRAGVGLCEYDKATGKETVKVPMDVYYADVSYTKDYIFLRTLDSADFNQCVLLAYDRDYNLLGKLELEKIGLRFPFLEYTTANAIYFSADGGTITHYIDPHHLDRLELIQLVDPTARSHG